MSKKHAPLSDRPSDAAAPEEIAACSCGAIWLLRLWLLPVGALLTALWLLPLLWGGTVPAGGLSLTAALSLLFLLWYPPHYLRSRRVSAGRYLRVSAGLFWRRQSGLPLTAVRRLTRLETPLSRLFHCRSLLLHYPGGWLLLSALDYRTSDALETAFEVVRP